MAEITETNRRTERVRVTMSWWIDVAIVDTESPGVHASGWFADTAAIVDLCDPQRPSFMRIERVERSDHV